MTNLTPQETDGHRRLFGILAMTIGVLVAGLCGVCSLAMVGVGGATNFHDPNAVMWDAAVAVIGGGSTLVGVATFAVGLVIYRRK